MFLPRTTETADSYFLCVGLHKSTTRPLTPVFVARQIRNDLKIYSCIVPTWEYALQTCKSLLQLRFAFRFRPIDTSLEETLIDIGKLFIRFCFETSGGVLNDSVGQDEGAGLQYLRYAGSFTLMIIVFLLNVSQVCLQCRQLLLELTNSFRNIAWCAS